MCIEATELTAQPPAGGDNTPTPVPAGGGNTQNGSQRPSVTLFVEGAPAAQGSKKFVGMSKKTGRAVLVEQSKKVTPWRKVVGAHVRQVMAEPIAAGVPVSLRLEFVMPRPKATPKTRPTPPAVKRPDADKLTRAICDALSDGVAYADDSQVVRLNVDKRIAELDETAGVRITITTTGGAQ